MNKSGKVTSSVFPTVNGNNKKPMDFEAQLPAQLYKHFLWWFMNPVN